MINNMLCIGDLIFRDALSRRHFERPSVKRQTKTEVDIRNVSGFGMMSTDLGYFSYDVTSYLRIPVGKKFRFRNHSSRKMGR